MDNHKKEKGEKTMKRIIAKLSIIMLIITAVFGTGSRVSAEEKMTKKSDVTTILSHEETEQKEPDSIEKNQAASRDYMRLMSYLQTEASDSLCHAFSGAYINESNNLVVRLIEFIGQNELRELNWETGVVFENGSNSYFEDMSRLDRINEKLVEVNCSVLEKNAVPEYTDLMGFYPCTNYNVTDGVIEVRLVASDQNAFENAIHLFKKVVADNDGIVFRIATIEENTFHMASFSANPGSSITITGAGDYSLGFRAYYDFDGETNYGFVTCAHGNSVGQTVKLNPKTSGSIMSLGIIDKRTLGGSVDAAFIRVTNGNAYLTQTVQYSSNSLNGSTGGTVYQPATLNGTYYTPAVGTVFYKSGGATKLTKGSVVSTNESGYCNGIYFSSLILSNGSLETPQMVQAGDSGGVAFSMISGTTARCVGIALGYSTWNYYFLKPGPILTALNIIMY